MTKDEETFDRFWKKATIAAFVFMAIAFVIVIAMYVWVKQQEDLPPSNPENQPPAVSH